MPEPVAAALERLQMSGMYWSEINRGLNYNADLALVAQALAAETDRADDATRAWTEMGPALALAHERVMRQDQMLRYIAYVLTGDEAADPQQAADGAVQALAEREGLLRRVVEWHEAPFLRPEGGHQAITDLVAEIRSLLPKAAPRGA